MPPILYHFPTNVVLDRLTQDYVADTAALLGRSILPLQNEMAQVVQWDEIEKETGLTRQHALGSDVKIGQRPGSKVRQYRPGYFKESELIKEDELLVARAFATLGAVVNIDELVSRRLKARINKDFFTIEKLIWDCLQGEIAMTDENGAGINETFPVQPYNLLVGWDDRANAQPIKEFNAIKLLYRGTNATSRGAKAYMNSQRVNYLLENTNAADLRGFHAENFRETVQTLDRVNSLLTPRGLPTIVEFDEGYYDAAGNFQLYIPDDTTIVVGNRQIGKTGDFALTPSLHRNVNGMPAPGMFSLIEINGQPNNAGGFSVGEIGASSNPKIQVTTGFYGGPRLYYPKDVIVMKDA